MTEETRRTEKAGKFAGMTFVFTGHAEKKRSREGSRRKRWSPRKAGKAGGSVGRQGKTSYVVVGEDPGLEIR